MSEPLSIDFVPTRASEPRPDLRIVHSVEQPPFDHASFIDYLAMKHPDSSITVITKVLEQTGILPSEHSGAEQDAQKRQHLLERITIAKTYFDAHYIDASSSIGKNKALLLDLFEKTEQFDDEPALAALAFLSKDGVMNRLSKKMKPVINEAEYLYRIILADEHHIKLEGDA